ncbi:MAG: CoA transferase, partial [Gammaproteobacteria bacterium]|nr:CoA transferase [Gammaproteobacteria bacterium]NIT62919.1 CoA transferase [Gammaproteobacteria bacterium]NIV19879.1 CoA transferase [Gammaproteobacteria bacterium]NIY31499.1 CoA transferase [Gammaproteobacteria bacterium]
MESTGALQGIRVLDFSSVLSGPFATMLLADLGAEVVRVERPDGGDALRHSPPQRHGESAYFFCANRNKKSIVVDVKAPPGLALIRRLLPGF